MDEEIRKQLMGAQLKTQGKYMERLDRAHKEILNLAKQLQTFKEGRSTEDYRDIVVQVLATGYGLQKISVSMSSIAWRLGELEFLLDESEEE
jgi:hypothetical protein